MWPYVYMLIIWVLVWTELWLNVRKNSKSIFTLIFCLTNMSSWDLLLWRMSSYLVTKIVHIVSLHRLVNMITCTCTMYIGRFYPKKPWRNSVHCMCIVMMSSDTWILKDCFQLCLLLYIKYCYMLLCYHLHMVVM